MKYSTHVDLLVSSIIYLGSQPHWWGRSVPKMAEVLNQDPVRLRATFKGFPGIFRESMSKNAQGEHFYGLQARYAEYQSKDGEEPSGDTLIPVLSVEKQKLLLEFVQRMADQEKQGSRALATLVMSGMTVAISAVSLFLLASGTSGMKEPGPSQAVEQNLKEKP